MSQQNPWFAILKGNRRAHTRLFCFHYAGGSVSVFRDWSKALPDHVELVAVRLPGHLGRYAEPFITSTETLVAQIHDALLGWLEKPYYLFGHSLGAILAYEVASSLERSLQRRPEHLIVAGRRAPHLADLPSSSSTLQEAELIAKVREYEGTSDAIFLSRHLLAALLPIWRADFAMSESYTYRPRAPLSCPVTAIGGRDDKWVPEEDLRAWQTLTTAGFASHMIPGSHFFIEEQRARSSFLGCINAILCGESRRRTG